jgi:hypothetical protein
MARNEDSRSAIGGSLQAPRQQATANEDHHVDQQVDRVDV